MNKKLVSKQTCRVCLIQTSKNIDYVSEEHIDMMQIVLLDVPSTHYENSKICSPCDILLKDIFNFKSSCLEIEDNIHDYRSDSIAQVNLEKLVGLTENDYNSNSKICRTCFKVIDDDFFPLCKRSTLLQAHQQKCLPEMDLSLTIEPVMCIDCVKMLQTYFNFLTRSMKNYISLKLTERKKKIKPKILVDTHCSNIQIDDKEMCVTQDNKTDHVNNKTAEELDNCTPNIESTDQIHQEKNTQICLISEVIGSAVDNEKVDFDIKNKPNDHQIIVPSGTGDVDANKKNAPLNSNKKLVTNNVETHKTIEGDTINDNNSLESEERQDKHNENHNESDCDNRLDINIMKISEERNINQAERRDNDSLSDDKLVGNKKRQAKNDENHKIKSDSDSRLGNDTEKKIEMCPIPSEISLKEESRQDKNNESNHNESDSDNRFDNGITEVCEDYNDNESNSDNRLGNDRAEIHENANTDPEKKMEICPIPNEISLEEESRQDKNNESNHNESDSDNSFDNDIIEICEDSNDITSTTIDNDTTYECTDNNLSKEPSNITEVNQNIDMSINNTDLNKNASINNNIETIDLDLSDTEKSTTNVESTQLQCASTSQQNMSDGKEVRKENKTKSYKRKLRSSKNKSHSNEDSDFNPQSMSESSSDEFEELYIPVKPKRLRPTRHRCSYCTASCTSISGLKAHMMSYHSHIPNVQTHLMQELVQLREQVQRLENLQHTNMNNSHLNKQRVPNSPIHVNSVPILTSLLSRNVGNTYVVHSGTNPVSSVFAVQSGTNPVSSVYAVQSGTNSVSSVYAVQSGTNSVSSVYDVQSGTNSVSSVYDVQSGTNSVSSVYAVQSGTNSVSSVYAVQSGTNPMSSVQVDNPMYAKSDRFNLILNNMSVSDSDVRSKSKNKTRNKQVSSESLTQIPNTSTISNSIANYVVNFTKPYIVTRTVPLSSIPVVTVAPSVHEQTLPKSTLNVMTISDDDDTDLEVIDNDVISNQANDSNNTVVTAQKCSLVCVDDVADIDAELNAAQSDVDPLLLENPPDHAINTELNVQNKPSENSSISRVNQNRCNEEKIDNQTTENPLNNSTKQDVLSNSFPKSGINIISIDVVEQSSSSSANDKKRANSEEISNTGLSQTHVKTPSVIDDCINSSSQVSPNCMSTGRNDLEINSVIADLEEILATSSNAKQTVTPNETTCGSNNQIIAMDTAEINCSLTSEQPIGDLETAAKKSVQNCENRSLEDLEESNNSSRKTTESNLNTNGLNDTTTTLNDSDEGNNNDNADGEDNAGGSDLEGDADTAPTSRITEVKNSQSSIPENHSNDNANSTSNVVEIADSDSETTTPAIPLPKSKIASLIILNDHMCNTNTLSVFKCDWCPFNTRYFQLIDMHILTHFNLFLVNNNEYSCIKCTSKFPNTFQLLFHLQSEHKHFCYKLCFWCVNCAQVFPKKLNVRRHFKTCSRKGISVKLFKSNDVVYCMLCNYETTNQDNAKVHARSCMTKRMKTTETVVLE